MKSYEALFQASLYIENDEWTKDTLAGLPTCKGVLLFADANDRPVQLLQAANCRRTAQARLFHNDGEDVVRKKADVSELTTAIYYTCCYNNFLSQITYTRLAHAVFEKDADTWIQLPRISVAAIDIDSFLPYFYVSDTITEQSGRQQFGLFPTRKAATEFCETLNTIFVLCRNPALLQTGRESSCPYLQMHTCPGPCLNSDLKENYRENVKLALRAAAEGIASALQHFRQQMQYASEQMAFEQAQQHKKKIELLNKLARRDFTYVHRLEDLCFLHIDVGPKEKVENSRRKVRQLMWFRITAETITYLGNLIPTCQDNLKQFLETNWSNNQNALHTDNRKERLALISLQLYRSQQAGVWMDCSNGIWIEPLISDLNDCFKVQITS